MGTAVNLFARTQAVLPASIRPSLKLAVAQFLKVSSGRNSIKSVVKLDILRSGTEAAARHLGVQGYEVFVTLRCGSCVRLKRHSNVTN
jgi:hypothetical protein